MKYVDPTKQCQFCQDNSMVIDYKNVPLLLNNVDYFGRMKKSYYKGTCRKDQNRLSNAIKKARHMGLLSFVR